ncbi:MAG: hypothetical protein ICV68_15445 [Pyrinomonadaceae bacterium]|nr:hypothetical protein [Pyrinomonadaceae bacterium]
MNIGLKQEFQMHRKNKNIFGIGISIALMVFQQDTSRSDIYDKAQASMHLIQRQLEAFLTAVKICFQFWG